MKKFGRVFKKNNEKINDGKKIEYEKDLKKKIDSNLMMICH